MIAVLSTMLGSVLIAGCLIAAALSLILYLGRSSRTLLYLCVYMILQLFLELITQGYESQSTIFIIIFDFFSAPNVIKSLLYAACAVLMPMILTSAIGRPVEVRLQIAAAVVALWLIFFPLWGSQTGFLYFCYLLPYQLFLVITAVIGIRWIKKLPQQNHFPMLLHLLIGVLVLTVLTITEDYLTGSFYGLQRDVSAIVDAGQMKSRNYCENVMQLGMAGYVIYAVARILIDALRAAPSDGSQEQPENTDRLVDKFADSIGLSAREKEILPLLLQNKGVQEISKSLFISTGTVKSHTHNIYQKANVSDRSALLEKASAFFDETS